MYLRGRMHLSTVDFCREYYMTFITGSMMNRSVFIVKNFIYAKDFLIKRKRLYSNVNDYSLQMFSMIQLLW